MSRPRRPGVLVEPAAVGRTALVLLALLGAAYLALVGSEVGESWTGTELEAAALMAGAEARVRERRAELGWRPDPEVDPHGTGMLGLEGGPYTTTLGDPASKRSAADPRMAALLARLYREAGAMPGEVVAIGASASFPGLVLASIAAAEALDLRPVLVASVGASTWGANAEGFSLVELLSWLEDSPLAGFETAAVSLGGEADAGYGLEPEARAAARAAIAAAGLPLLDPSSTRDSVLARLGLYDRAAAASRIALYVNIGGNVASAGSGAALLALEPGLGKAPFARVPVENRGVLHEMSARGIPCLHLLHLRGLAARYGLPWDAAPLLHPEAPPRGRGIAGGLGATTAAALYLALACLVAAAGLLAGRRGRGPALP